MSEATFDNIIALLAASSAAIGVVEKKERNETGKGFNFRGVDIVVNATSPEFREHGIVVVPESLDRVYEQIEVGEKRTLMGHVMLRVRYTFYGPAGDSVAATVDSEAFDSGDKAVAKAMSIAFRTALLQVLMLPTDESDPDATSYERAASAPSSPPAARSAAKDAKPPTSAPHATEAQVRAVFGKAKTLGWSQEYLCASIKRATGKDHPDSLTAAEARKVLDGLQTKIDDAKEPEPGPAPDAEPAEDPEIPY